MKLDSYWQCHKPADSHVRFVKTVSHPYRSGETMYWWCLGALLIAFALTGCTADQPSTPVWTQEETLPPAWTNTPAPTLTTTPPATPATSPLFPTQQVTVNPTPTLEPLVIPLLPPCQPMPITSIRMVNSTTGWGIGQGDRILRTQDGGATWQDVSPPDPVISEEGITRRRRHFFLDAQHAWLVAYDLRSDPYGWVVMRAKVWRTCDGGTSWIDSDAPTYKEQSEAFGPAILFIDPQHGWLRITLGGAMNHVYFALFRTSDGGHTWEIIIDPMVDSFKFVRDKTGMVFTDPQRGIFTRDTHMLYYSVFVDWSEDGGRTWASRDLPLPVEETDFFIKNSCGVWSPHYFSPTLVKLALECKLLKEDNFDYLGFLYTSEDGGQTWQINPLPENPSVYSSLDFINPEVGWRFGGSIQQTLDGGITWTTLSSVSWRGVYSFIDAQHGWVVAREEDTYALMETFDGGSTWQGLCSSTIE